MTDEEPPKEPLSGSSPKAFDPLCPKCGHEFSLADLKRMAIGDGLQRWIVARLPDGTVMPVRFADFNPVTMTDALSEGRTFAPEEVVRVYRVGAAGQDSAILAPTHLTPFGALKRRFWQWWFNA